jgi:hypothetical protein
MAHARRGIGIINSAYPTGIQAITTFHNELSAIAAFALVTLAWREIVMPIGRYITWVGTSLLALLFVADWYLPKLSPGPARDASNKPIIRIASIHQPPERVVIDTSQPTIVPPPTPLGDAVPGEPSPLQSYASTAPPPIPIDDDKKRRKGIKRQGPKVAAYQAPLASIPAAASGSPPTTLPPTKISFLDIISGQLVKNLFHLR